MAATTTAGPELAKTADGLDSSPTGASLNSNNPYNSSASNDPFVTTPSTTNDHSQRTPTNGPDMSDSPAVYSPAQVKIRLESHLAETERRIQEASRLGTSLVQQRRDLSQRLKEVEKEKQAGEIGPELRKRLIDVEKEYHEVGRESARAFLGPKATSAGVDRSNASPLPPGAQRPASPSKLSADATDSPSKLSVPSRRSRNQASNGVHDSEFYAEISTSLLTQVRNLQAILVERDEILKNVNDEKARLEAEAEGFSQRLRGLNESEQRYKDENWNLETQTHDLMGANKQAADREQKLTQSLNAANAEKATAQRELDELKQMSGKLMEDQSTSRKQHDTELSTLRRNMNVAEMERSAMQRKIEELNSQNQELAKAVAGRMRQDEIMPSTEIDPEQIESMDDTGTPESSPPPSPSKGTPRHSHLESETLKSSLHHAHRMIQNLKGNIHREKTEKVELKRMLQDARDELDMRRGEGGLAGAVGAAKRRKGASEKETFKKPPKPALLGSSRNSKNEVVMDEAGWEDHTGENSPSRRAGKSGGAGSVSEDATEGSDAFETANERDESNTETDAFQTGAESLEGDSSDELTETEGGALRPSNMRTSRSSRVSTNPTIKASNRDSFASTASTSTEEDDKSTARTPPHLPQQRYRLKINRGSAQRRSRASADSGGLYDSPASVKDSPASFVSNSSQPTKPGQSLFAELGDLQGGDSDDDSRSMRSSIVSRGSTISRQGTAHRRTDTSIPPVPKPPMVDSSMMTDPYEASIPGTTPADERTLVEEPANVEATEDKGPHQGMVGQGFGTIVTPAIDTEGIQSESASVVASPVETVPLAFAPIRSLQIEPVEVAAPSSHAPLALSAIQSQQTQPAAAEAEAPSTSGFPAGSTFKPVALGDAATSSGAQTGSTFKPFSSNRDTPPPRNAKRMGGVFDDGDVPEDDPFTEQGEDKTKHEPVKGGIFSSVFRWGKATPPPQATSAVDEGSRKSVEPVEGSIHHVNAAETPGSDLRPDSQTYQEPSRVVVPPKAMADHGAQTELSSEQIDQFMREMRNRERQPESNMDQGVRSIPNSPLRSHPGPGLAATVRSHRSQESIGSNTSKPRMKLTEPGYGQDAAALKGLRRPVSSGSMRNSSGAHPPLPPDHKEAIAAAAQRVSTDQTGVMGPPLAPASAYKSNSTTRRPHTPSSQYQQTPSTRGGTTPRPRHSTARSEISTVGTRRSSISSFASDLDERFNIRTEGRGLDYGPGTDPRMIQAITQTMIGEYLWKYTRKAGRSETSAKRHQRFFWVHPYTRTLYWSDRDPATAGRAELKGKSVAIDAVRVVADDNPIPPGLHRKSIIIMTPNNGRTVKFTATTGQRHETWFNALSYLLLRTGPENTAYAGAMGGGAYDDGMTGEDVDEFNPRTYSRRERSRGNTSVASYNSRATAHRSGASPTRNMASHSSRSRISGAPPVSYVNRAPTMTPSGTATSRVSQQSAQHSRVQSGSLSRLSGIFRPGSTFRGSFSSRKSRHSVKPGSVYEEGEGATAATDDDVPEDLRSAFARQEREKAGLENVRACCDGKHDVSSLATHPHPHSHSHTPNQSISNRHRSQASRYSSVNGAATDGANDPRDPASESAVEDGGVEQTRRQLESAERVGADGSRA
ncbi:MAG: hypothetical protein M1817_000894 [Caeruleum heppii]|nr:MAG: hypothetical protein M1817_000894 [Caeruleum heppii]